MGWLVTGANVLTPSPLRWVFFPPASSPFHIVDSATPVTYNDIIFMPSRVSPMHQPSDSLFQTVRVNRASHDIVEQIKDSIFSGKLSPGDRLPSEKELVTQFGLSRITIRDALRVLESRGLISIKVGAGGGAFVTQPTDEPMTQVFQDMIRLQRVGAKELVEARLVIETSIVTFAADRATQKDLDKMRLAIAQARTAQANGEQRFTPYSVDFHMALAQAAKNRVLLFTVNSFRTPFYETLDKLTPDDRMARRAIDDHQSILDAIVERDAEKARRIMREHLTYFRKRAEKVEQPK